jgi:hypothetical protein
VFPVKYGLYLCVPYGSYNKQRLFPYTAFVSQLVSHTQNYRVSGLFLMSGILNTRKQNYSETGSVSVLR